MLNPPYRSSVGEAEGRDVRAGHQRWRRREQHEERGGRGGGVPRRDAARGRPCDGHRRRRAHGHGHVHAERGGPIAGAYTRPLISST